MLKKGIIMTLCSSYAIVMEKGGAFHRIQLKENITIGQAILFTDDDILTQGISIRSQLRPLIALAAALMLFLIPTLYSIQSPYAVVSLDVNPSIEILLNKDGIVKKVITQNPDGANLTLNMLKGQPLDTALNTLHDELTRNNFMTTSPSVLVSYADLKANTLELGTSLEVSMAENFKDAHIVYLPSDKQTYEQSSKAHISLGRYSASHLLGEQLPDIDFETIDIPSLIHYLEPADDSDDDQASESISNSNANTLDDSNENSKDDDSNDDLDDATGKDDDDSGDDSDDDSANSNASSNNHVGDDGVDSNASVVDKNDTDDDSDDKHDNNDDDSDDDSDDKHDNNDDSDDDSDNDNANNDSDDDADNKPTNNGSNSEYDSDDRGDNDDDSDDDSDNDNANNDSADDSDDDNDDDDLDD